MGEPTQRQLTLWVKQRTALRLNARHEIDKLKMLLGQQPVNEDEVDISKSKVTDYRARLATLDEMVLPHADENKLDKYLLESTELDSEILHEILVAEKALARLLAANVQQQVPSHQHHPMPVMKTTKLPELELAKFGGDPLKWKTFWDNFNAAIHSQSHIEPVHKFQYLVSVLSGEPARLIDGYQLTDANYAVVVSVLKERYDNEDLCVFAHLDAMITMKPASGDTSDMQRVYDQCEAHIRSLVALGMSESTFGRVFTPLILSKMPRFIRVELYRSNGARAWTLDSLRKLLKDEILARQLGANSFASTSGDGGRESQSRRSYGRGHEAPSTGASLVASGDTRPRSGRPVKPYYPCAFCQDTEHFSSSCVKFKTLESRLAALGNRCNICLSKAHDSKACRKRIGKCRICGEQRVHHQSICPKAFSNLEFGQKGTGLSVCLQQHVPATTILSKIDNGHRPRQAIMPLAVTTVRGKKCKRSARIILDTASTQSFARADLLKAIGAKRIGTDYLGLAGIQAETRTIEPYGCYELIVVLEDGAEMSLTVHALKNISCPVDKPTLDLSKYPILGKLKLAEPVPETTSEVQLDIMVGLDHYYELVSDEQIRLDKGLVLLGTKLGYVITGCVEAKEENSEQHDEISLIVTSQHSDSQMDDDLQRLWRLEDVGCRENPVSSDVEVAKQKFLESIQYDATAQRYSVRWPWKIDRPNLPDNFGVAIGRLKSLLKRLDAETLVQYNEVIMSQLAKGIVEEAPDEPTGPLVHYIPHHCVVRPDKATTKLRVVYDASCKASRYELCLNECIYRGPVLLADSCGLLLRFRTHAIALTSDIEKAFLQVGLQEVDRDVTRFLWIKDVTKPLSKENLAVFRFARVLFGIIASPYMLGGTVKFHMENVVGTLIALQIVRDNYVDNVITGDDTSEEALEFYRQSKRAFKSASMNLREWFSNDATTIQGIPQPDRGVGKITTVLGLLWDTQKDELYCKNKLGDNAGNATKRSMLKAVATMFDPLGFLAPVTIKAKMLLQDVWKQASSWDEPLASEIQQKWDQLHPDLTRSAEVTLPRRSIYLRAEKDDSVSSNLIFAKARVCPLKENNLTIPRLELTALALGCKLLKFVESELHLGQLQLYAWTDSMCTYHWIVENSEEKVAKRPVYVKNRIREILSKGPFVLRYVPTAVNPADLLSRGMPPTELQTCQRWWQGPEFLSQPADVWPVTPAFRSDYGEAEEGNASNSQAALQVSARTYIPKQWGRLDPARFSQLRRLLRVTAWIQRFAQNAREPRKCIKGELTAYEISKALQTWLKQVQQEYAGERAKEFEATKRILKLFADPAGVLRCQGRIDNTEAAYEERFPIFLPRRGRLTELLVSEIHEQQMHTGTQQTLAALRQRYWLPKGRLEVKRVIAQQCITCKRQRGGPYQAPDPPPLPEFRVAHGASFSCAGIDYLGPLTIRQPGTQALVKCWICLFTCASTRAVHLEVVTDMSAHQFLLALRRFAALYGCPVIVGCDNAKQFKAGEQVTASLWKEAVEGPAVRAFSAQKGITWKYIVEQAPWMGGLYERMVGIVKKALRCALQRQLLSLVELQTLCIEICAVVNERPLTYVADDLNDSPRPVRPCDLITRNRPGFPALADDDTDDTDYVPSNTTRSSLIHTWKRLQKRLNVFRDTWHRDYLLAIRERHWCHNRRGSAPEAPSVGAVVLIYKEHMPRANWVLGRIVELNRSEDNAVRSARVRLPGGSVLQRPLQQLYPVEVQNDEPCQSVPGDGQRAVTSVRAWGLESSDSETD